jgi:hypothetical protein
MNVNDYWEIQTGETKGLKNLKYVLNSKLPVNLDIAKAIINVIRNTLDICS